MQKQVSIGDILDKYGDRYISRNHITGQQKGLIHLLSACRTNGLGSHFEVCDQCRYQVKAYDSCRNRHCPTCQQKDKLEWQDKRMKELLPLGYYHLVFTLPHELNLLCLQNKKVMYGLLFKAASQTVIELAKDPEHLGGDVGLITVLHTWGQNMMEHPHLHCIMPSGGLSRDKQHWVHPRKKNKFFVHVKVLSRIFRGKYLDLLKKSCANAELSFSGKLSAIKGPRQFEGFLSQLYKKEWVVNIQAPMGKPGKILEYLSRYVFRIAITDRRIIEVKNGKVLLWWKDYRTNRFCKMWLEIDEFIRRFLLHVLPKGFFKVRYYGIFASRYRKQNMETAKAILEQEAADLNEEKLEDGLQVWEKTNTVWAEIHEAIVNYKKPNCPQCGKGRLHFAGRVYNDPNPPG